MGAKDVNSKLLKCKIKKRVRVSSKVGRGGGDDLHTIKRPKRKTRDYKPHRHKNVRLNLFQEFIVYLIYIRRAFDTDILAKKFLGSTSKASVKCVRSVLCTWIAAIDKILGAEEWWVKPEHRNRTVSKAFRDCPQVLCIGDCTCVFCGSGRTSELINQQLHSAYYGHTALFVHQ